MMDCVDSPAPPLSAPLPPPLASVLGSPGLLPGGAVRAVLCGAGLAGTGAVAAGPGEGAAPGAPGGVSASWMVGFHAAADCAAAGVASRASVRAAASAFATGP